MENENNIFTNGENRDVYSESPSTDEAVQPVDAEAEGVPSYADDSEATTPPEVHPGVVYTYSASNDTTSATKVAESDNKDPTVTFEAVPQPVEVNSNSGIKVFFTVIAITVALIIAISSGFILGTKSGTTHHFYQGGTQQAGKDDSMLATNKNKVFQNVNKSVVCITVYNEKGAQGYASGVIYTADGYIVTNDHIYSEVSSPKFLVTTSDGAEYEAKFIAGDTRSDLAVLKVEAKNLAKATFGYSDQVAVGEEVIAIGYPSGADSKSILTSGTISSANIRFTSTSSYSMKMLQTDTPINPGNSGGALVNMYSQVIGIPSVKLAGTEYDNVGYAIPSNTVVKIVDSLITYGYVADRGRLGITYTAVDSITAELENIPKGMKVQEVTIESDLSGKGIKSGDVITHINDVEITSSSVALDIIESTKPGVTLSFTVYHVATGESDTVLAVLLADRGSSSYTNSVIDDSQNGLKDPFGNGSLDDFYSDH